MVLGEVGVGALCAVERIRLDRLFLHVRLRGVRVGVRHFGRAAVRPGVGGVPEVEDEGAGGGEDDVAARGG